MSLIPSESYSFPDHFTKTVAPSRKPKKEEPEAEPVQTQPMPRIMAMPSPRMQSATENRRPTTEPKRDVDPMPAPNPALRRASAPPPRIPDPTVGKQTFPPILKPKTNATMRAPAMDPAPLTEISAPEIDAPEISTPPPKTPAPVRKVIQMPVAPVVPVSPAALERTAAPAIPKRTPQFTVTTSQPDFFELFAQNGDSTLAARRRKMKMRRFIVYESIAVAILLPLATIGIMRHPSNAILTWILNISTIAAAFAAALIPILFYAATPTLPEIDR